MNIENIEDLKDFISRNKSYFVISKDEIEFLLPSLKLENFYDNTYFVCLDRNDSVMYVVISYLSLDNFNDSYNNHLVKNNGLIYMIKPTARMLVLDLI